MTLVSSFVCCIDISLTDYLSGNDLIEVEEIYDKMEG